MIRDTDDGAIYPSKKEIETQCRPIAGADACVWLIGGRAKKLECAFWNRPDNLVKLFMAGKTIAKRNGCDEVYTKGVMPVGRCPSCFCNPCQCLFSAR